MVINRRLVPSPLATSSDNVTSIFIYNKENQDPPNTLFQAEHSNCLEFINYMFRPIWAIIKEQPAVQ